MAKTLWQTVRCYDVIKLAGQTRMGYDGTNFIPKGTPRKDVEQFMVYLGYEKLEKDKLTGRRSTPFSYYRDKDYRHITGVYSEVYADGHGGIGVWTRTTIWRSETDKDIQNHTIKELRKRFGGHFATDYGKNRYFRDNAPYIEKAEGGCYEAYSRFRGNLVRMRVFMMNQPFGEDHGPPITEIDFMDSMNPKIIATNLVVSFLVSIIEDYLRSSYVALLKYSDRREQIFGNARVGSSELLGISADDLTVEEAVSRRRSFQDLKKAQAALREVDANIDIHGSLARPIEDQDERPYDAISRLIQHRHDLIHSASLNHAYYPDIARRDVETVATGIQRVYADLRKLYGWQEDLDFT